MLLTKRSLKLATFSVISALLGLVFGLLETFAGFVSLFESKLNYINKKIAENIFFEKLVKNQETLLRNFKIKKKKVYETTTTKNTSKVYVESKYKINF